MANENVTKDTTKDREQYDDALRGLEEVMRGLVIIKTKVAAQPNKWGSVVGLEQTDLVEAVDLCATSLRELKLVFERFRLPAATGGARESLSLKVDKILSRS
jgi:hypothetical protein